MQKGLFALLLGGLGIGITEFVMMGLLPDLSSNLAISIPEAGHLISAYALGVVIGAPLLTLGTSTYSPKKVLIFLMILFTIFNASSAFCPNYNILILTRFLSGLPHGAFFGIGSVVASRLAKKGKESQSISIMFAGLTIANLIGVPLGTFIGHSYSWRYTFILVATIGLSTIIALKIWMPATEAHKNANIKNELSFFNHINSWLIILIISIGTGGLFAWISYIAPLLTLVTHFTASAIPYIMALAGLGMVIGNIIGGKLADRYSPINTVILLLFIMTFSLVTIYFTAQYQALTLIMTFITGATSFALVSPIQMLMINHSKGSEMFASSISQACFNVGNALGAFLGGLPIVYGFNYNYPELVGATMAFVGTIIVTSLIIRTNKKTLVRMKAVAAEKTS